MLLSRRVAIGAGLGLLLALAAGAALLRTIGAGACGATEVTSLPSPDGTYRAVLYGYDCGATTGFATDVSVLAAGEAVTGPGNVFVADDNDGKAARAAWGGPWVELEWTGPEALTLRYDRTAHVSAARNLNDWVQLRFIPVAR